MLETLGHTVDVAWDGSECIEQLFDANGKPLCLEGDEAHSSSSDVPDGLR